MCILNLPGIEKKLFMPTSNTEMVDVKNRLTCVGLICIVVPVS